MIDQHLNPRHQALLDFLNQKGFASVAQLSRVLYISEITVRRDLKRLESQNLLMRTHGGAILTNNLRVDPPFNLNARINVAEKRSSEREPPSWLRMAPPYSLTPPAPAVKCSLTWQSARGSRCLPVV